MAQITSISNGEAMSSVRTKLNDVITNVNLLDPTDWVDYSSTSTIVGWSSFTNKLLSYRILGKQMFVMFSFIGTSNSTTVTFTIPNDAVGTTGWIVFGYAVNNGAATGAGLIQRISANTIGCYRDSIGTAWTASGTKRISGEFFIEIS